MAESTSPKSGPGEFARKVQRQLSRSKEKVLQKLGKTAESRDEEFDSYVQDFIDQQTDGNRIYKDLKSYLNAVRDMRDASKHLFQSLFDAYESDWAAEEDLGGIVEGEDLLWNDYEVKVLDQAIRTMESYIFQFPDVKDKIAKRGRKLVDYDSSLHHLEALQTAKKRDDVKVAKAEEEMNAAKGVFEGINNELKTELPALFDSRIGCYVTVFSAISNLRSIFLKEMTTFNQDLQNVMKELQGQHPDKVFVVRPFQRTGSLMRRALLSPRAWGYSPKPPHRRSNPRSPDRPRFDSDTLSRQSSSLAFSPTSLPEEEPLAEVGDGDGASTHSVPNSSPAEPEPESNKEGASAGAAEEELKPEEDQKTGAEEKDEEEEEEEEGAAEPKASSDHHSIASDHKGEGENLLQTESSSGLDNSHDSESLELQLAAVDNGPLYIEETTDSPVAPETLPSDGLENGGIPGLDPDSQKEIPVEKPVSANSKSTEV